jgi:site-specific recombinase XerD
VALSLPESVFDGKLPEGHAVPRMTVVQPGPSTGLERAVEDYLSSCRARGLSPRTMTAYGNPLRRVFLPWCAGQGVAEVDQLDQRTLDRFTAHLLEAGGANGSLSKFSVAAYVRPVRQLLAWASKEGERVAGKPQLPLLPRRVRRPEPRGDHSPRGGRDRRTRPADRQRLFLALRRGRDGVYGALTVSGVEQLVRTAAQSAGLDIHRVRPHALRHAYVTHALRGGMNPMLVAQVVGHSSLRMIEQVYSHLTIGDAHAAVMRLLTQEK